VGVELVGGEVASCAAVFVRPVNVPHREGLAAGLGCDLDNAGMPLVDSSGRTSAVGVWAAGMRWTRPQAATIRTWLVENLSAPRKQRHTARRVWQRLVDEHAAVVAESTVRRHVRLVRAELESGTPLVTVPQTHLAGEEAEVEPSSWPRLGSNEGLRARGRDALAHGDERLSSPGPGYSVSISGGGVHQFGRARRDRDWRADEVALVDLVEAVDVLADWLVGDASNT